MLKILISGAGVAGPTLAYWLAHYRFEPTIVERAPKLRTGGYVIDFWGTGYDLADRMGLLPEVREKGYMVQELRVVNRNGQRVAGFPVQAFAHATMGRYISIPRGELSAAIFRKIEGQIETIFGDSIASIEQTTDAVRVTFKSGVARNFDIVVGADGLHSRVRELVFGPEDRWEHYLGIKVAAFEGEGYQPRDELVYVMYTNVGQQVGRFTMRDDRTLIHFTFADNEVGAATRTDIETEKKILRKRFGNSGWECRKILHALDSTDDLYFDRVSQIRMGSPPQPLWTRGRVALIGDAASCVSLLAGEGTGLAMTAAYILAGELHRASGDYATAFARYQELFGPFVLQKQQAALRFASTFAPKSKFAIFLRNQIMNLLGVPWIAALAFRRSLADKIAIPNYGQPLVPDAELAAVTRRRA